MITYYVLGFAFNQDMSSVALIRKNRPKWQAGRLNGIGGHIELGEFAEDAMTREFEEETGVNIINWNRYGEFRGLDYRVQCFTAVLTNGQWSQLESKTDEPVIVFGINEVMAYRAMPNLSWLIPLAVDWYREQKTFYVEYDK